MDNFDLKKYLTEGRLLKNTTNPILESIFDKVADFVKSKSDKEAAAIDAFKKNGIEVGKPFYMFRFGGGDGKNGENAYWMKDIATPEELKDLKVPVPVGFTDDRIKRDVIEKIVIQDIKENEEGIAEVSMVVGVYNFKTGKFLDEDGAKTISVEDATAIEKELGGEKEASDKVYSNIEMVPFAGSPWEK